MAAQVEDVSSLAAQMEDMGSLEDAEEAGPTTGEGGLTEEEMERICGKTVPVPKVEEVAGDWMKEDSKRKRPARFVGPAKGKYTWKEVAFDKLDERTKAAHNGAGGETITDYAWDDDEKKVSVYVEFETLDEVPDEFMEVEVVSPRHVVYNCLTAKGLRTMSLNQLFEDVARAKLIRKRGKNRVVLKLFKAHPGKWPWFQDALQSGFKGGLHEEALGHPTSTHNMGIDVNAGIDEPEAPFIQTRQKPGPEDPNDPFATIPEPEEDCVD